MGTSYYNLKEGKLTINLEITVARHEERIMQIEEYVDKQNGRLARIEEKLDKSYFWLVGLMGGVIASLLLLIVNLGIGR